MVTKKLIQSELAQVEEEHLDELYELIRQFIVNKKQTKKQSFMSKLRSIKIDAPEDLAENHDLYINGEKTF